MAAVRNGVGRETAHEVIKEHAVAVALEMRGVNGGDGNSVLDRLAADARLGINRQDLESLISQPLEFTGAARDQVAVVAAKVSKLVASSPEAATYRPEPIL